MADGSQRQERELWERIKVCQCGMGEVGDRGYVLECCVGRGQCRPPDKVRFLVR